MTHNKQFIFQFVLSAIMILAGAACTSPGNTDNMKNQPSDRFRISTSVVRSLFGDHARFIQARPDGTKVLAFECNVDGGSFCNVIDRANPRGGAKIADAASNEIVAGIGGWKMVEGSIGNAIEFVCEQSAGGYKCKLNRGAGWGDMTVS